MFEFLNRNLFLELYFQINHTYSIYIHILYETYTMYI